MIGTWTITDELGLRLVEFTTVLSVDVKNEHQVASIPVEKGSFADYNKVASPLDINVTLAVEGKDAELQEALETMDEFADGTDLVTLVTPNAIYADLNLETYSYKRSSADGILTVDCHLVEIKQVETTTTTTAYTRPKCKNATSTSTKDTGTANTTNTSIAADIKQSVFGTK